MLVVGGRGHLRRWGSEAGFLHWGTAYNELFISDLCPPIQIMYKIREPTLYPRN